jgi:hypothetical protein
MNLSLKIDWNEKREDKNEDKVRIKPEFLIEFAQR